MPVGLLSGDLAALLPTDTDSECEGLCAGLASAQSCLCLYQGCRPLLGTKVALALQMDFCHFFPPSYIFYCYHIFIYCLAVFFFFLLDAFGHLKSPLFSLQILKIIVKHVCGCCRPKTSSVLIACCLVLSTYIISCTSAVCPYGFAPT